MNALATRHTLHQVLRWRDLLWASILGDFKQRDPAGAQAVYDVLGEQPARALIGHSTSYARVAWPYLDVHAREDWIWAAQLVHRIWIRDALATEAPCAEDQVTASASVQVRIDAKAGLADEVLAPC